MADRVTVNRARKLPADLALLRVTNAKHRLPAVFGTTLLVLLALGVMIGAGIYSLSGKQAATMAGPAVIVSFVIAGLVCLLAALSYAEMSSTLPVSGSAYTFSYVTFGEVWAWLVGWALILELLIAAALVARVWAAYFVTMLDGFGVGITPWVAESSSVATGTSWIGAIVVVLLTGLIIAGSKLSGRVLASIVLVKIAVVVLIIVVGARHIDPSHYQPFVPPVVEGAGTADGTVIQTILGGSGNAFGIMGIFTAAGVIVFAYIGFDLIATAAEDARRPRKSIPKAMLLSIGIVTALYVAMAAVMVGLRPYTELDTDAPVTDALTAVGISWVPDVVNVGAVLALTTVILVVLTAQSRVLFAMGRDGLLPGTLGEVSATSSPARAAAIAGLAAGAVALDPGTAGREQLLVIGALFAFGFCSVGVIVLRRSQPDLERGFRVPFVPLLPLVSAAATIWLTLNLTWTTWREFGIWMAVGIVLYLVYGRGHSQLARSGATGRGTADGRAGSHARR